MMQRRICWPDPDATCLEGACLHCNQARYRSLAEIQQWAGQAGLVAHRNGTMVEATEALRYGLDHDFFQMDVR